MGAQQFRRCCRDILNVPAELSAPRGGDIIEYIYRNYPGKLTVLNVAERLNVTPRAVNESLSSIAEMNFTNFLNFIRIREAANLLLNTEKSVTDIAFHVGYNSLRSFNRNFLKWLKVTAGEFREPVTEQKDGSALISRQSHQFREEQS